MMPDLAQWSVFFAATFVLLLVPGPSVIYVMTQAIDHGPSGALWASLGLALGDLVQAVLTAAGLAALFASAVVPFQAVKYAGAAYLVVLGVRRLRRQEPDARSAGDVPVRAERPVSLIAQAFFALNPKTALFFVALFPQVIDGDARHVWTQMMLFGTAFTLVGMVTNFLYGSLGGRVASRFTTNPHFRSSARYASAATLIGLGVVAAVGG